MGKPTFTEEEIFNLELKAHGQVQYDLGRSAERERLVTLLEQVITEKTDAQYGADFDVKMELAQDIILVRRIIALIKGEN